MATQQEMQDDKTNFGLAFEEADVAPVEQTEDEAFGLTPDADPVEAPADASATEAPVEAIAETPAAEAVEPAAEEAIETPAEEVAEVAPTENWEQKYKTLQGKYNAEIAAKKESGSDEGSPVSEGDGMSVDSAVEALSRDFGEEFVAMIKAIARSEAMSAAGESIDEVGNTIEAIIGDMNDSKERAHFEKIYDVHPDFMEVAESPEFLEYLSQNPDDQSIVDGGSAREVIGLLTKFKGVQSQPDASDSEQGIPAGADDAEGVRSTGLHIPEAPTQSKDFAEAWDQF